MHAVHRCSVCTSMHGEVSGWHVPERDVRNGSLAAVVRCVYPAHVWPRVLRSTVLKVPRRHVRAVQFRSVSERPLHGNAVRGRCRPHVSPVFCVRRGDVRKSGVHTSHGHGVLVMRTGPVPDRQLGVAAVFHNAAAAVHTLLDTSV